jgi:hypothetical protein
MGTMNRKYYNLTRNNNLNEYLNINDDDLLQNLFLEVKKLEITETKGTFSHPTFKSVFLGAIFRTLTT